MGPQSRIRLQRLTDERQRTGQLIEDVLAAAEAEQRDLSDSEAQSLERYRARVVDLDTEVDAIAADLERDQHVRDVSALIRGESGGGGDDDGGNGDGNGGNGDGVVVYRTFAAYARDALAVRFPEIAERVEGGSVSEVQEAARDRLQRAVQNTLSSNVEGLVPPQHMAQIMDIIDRSRPIVDSARRVDLSRGKLTYPKIAQRPDVQKQSAEKTQGGSLNMQITLEELLADTYIGGGDLSWQTINWSTPDALALWFDLAAESYARQTETAAATELGTAAVGTLSPAFGTAGTEDFGSWRTSVVAAIASIYDTTGGRARTDTLYLSAARFFELAGLGTSDVSTLSAIGSLDMATMRGTFMGLRVVGSYGLTGETAIVGDSNAFLVGETPGAPVQLRAVEPSIGGMEVGVIGAFAAKVFDPDRFLKLNA